MRSVAPIQSPPAGRTSTRRIAGGRQPHRIERINTMSFQKIMPSDNAVFDAITRELHRQQDQIELIASENIVSAAVLKAQGSVFTNKYAEGYPGRRYYGGCEHADTVEQIAIDRAKALFGCDFANVQAHSGAQANSAVLFALLKPGDTLLGMSLSSGGHLTHGAPPTLSGKWFNAIGYGVRRDDALIDYDEVERLANAHRPRLIIAGGSSYPRVIDFARFRAIADSVDALLLVDAAHYAGLMVAGVYPSPFPHAHIVTSTTHKTLRGPRGGLIMTNDESLAKKLNSAVFPGLQGGPLMHVIAAKAVSFGEALEPGFRDYARAVVANARALAARLAQHGASIVSGGTDSHIVLVDLRPLGVTGKDAEVALEAAGLTCNKNGIPFDPERPAVTSGVRLGTAAGTTRGFGMAEFEQVGDLIASVLRSIGRDAQTSDAIAVRAKVCLEVKALCERFPIYASGT
jgi:glycine hydroxymethyltransferase